QISGRPIHLFAPRPSQKKLVTCVKPDLSSEPQNSSYQDASLNQSTKVLSLKPVEQDSSSSPSRNNIMPLSNNQKFLNPKDIQPRPLKRLTEDDVYTNSPSKKVARLNNGQRYWYKLHLESLVFRSIIYSILDMNERIQGA